MPAPPLGSEPAMVRTFAIIARRFLDEGPTQLDAEWVCPLTSRRRSGLCETCSNSATRGCQCRAAGRGGRPENCQRRQMPRDALGALVVRELCPVKPFI